MSDNSLKTSELIQAANIAGTDRILILYNANNSNSVPSTRTIPLSTFCANLIIQQNTPANSTANGLTGNLTFDNNYVYVCISNNVWTRSTLSSF